MFQIPDDFSGVIRNAMPLSLLAGKAGFLEGSVTSGDSLKGEAFSAYALVAHKRERQ